MLALLSGCNALWGLDELSYRERTPSSGGAGGGESGGAGGQAAGGAAGTGAVGGSGAAGGSSSVCGNGLIEAGEQCDDGNNSAGDGCLACAVECSAWGELKHPDTHHCYWVTASSDVWLDSRQLCLAAGGDLAALTTAAEHSFVLPLVTTNTFIGGHDRVVEGSFEWVTGEAWSYASWDAGEPNDYSSNEDCVEVRSSTGHWNDATCSTTNPGLCERPPPGTWR